MLDGQGEDTIHADCHAQRLLKVSDVDRNGVEHNQILSLRDSGERWEMCWITNPLVGECCVAKAAISSMNDTKLEM